MIADDLLYGELSEARLGGNRPPHSAGDYLTEKQRALEEGAIVDDHGNLRFLDEWGREHRDGDLPAVILADGTLEWWWHGQPHRDGGKPAIVRAGVGCTWAVDGKLHREDGPAVVVGSHEEWWINGEWIRTKSSRKRN